MLGEPFNHEPLDFVRRYRSSLDTIQEWLVEKPDSETPIRNATFLRRPIEPGLKPSAWTTEHVYPVILRRNGVHRASDSPSSDKTSLGSKFGRKIRVPKPLYPSPER